MKSLGTCNQPVSDEDECERALRYFIDENDDDKLGEWDEGHEAIANTPPVLQSTMQFPKGCLYMKSENPDVQHHFRWNGFESNEKCGKQLTNSYAFCVCKYSLY